MPYPISVKKNDYTKNKKDHVIATPYYLCQALSNILFDDSLLAPQSIVDVACGDGRLGQFIASNYNNKEIKLYGIEKTKPENTDQLWINPDNIIWKDFLSLDYYDVEHMIPNLIVCNPPFNNIDNSRKLLPELFLNQMFELWGERRPIMLFVPMGYRLNQRQKSTRYRELMERDARITSIISLPIDAFENVAFHSEIICFNIQGLKPHYFIDWEEYQPDEDYFE